jgi:hypothetical protein
MRMTTPPLRYRELRHYISGPFIWAMIVPVVFADICVEIYHRVCFPLYGMPYVIRSHYIRIADREKLPYLKWYEKIFCAYCGYVNGWLHYASVIAGRTENYWCPIKHLQERGYVPTAHELSFAEYGDGAALRRRYARHDELYGREKSGT